VDKHVRGWKGSSDHAPVWIELAERAGQKQQVKKNRKQFRNKPAKTAKQKQRY
jgi:bifunctional non-homologous end joining protein LigD